MSGDFLSGLGGFFGGLSAAAGYRKEADFYGKAAAYQKLSGQLQDTAMRRQTFQIIGSTEAATASSGLKMGGSAENVLRSNAQQASLSRSIADINSNIQVQSFLAQQEAANVEASASEIGAFTGLASSLTSFAGSFMSMGG